MSDKERVEELLAQLDDEATRHLEAQHQGAKENTRLRNEVKRLQNALQVRECASHEDRKFDRFKSEFGYGRLDRNKAVLAKFERPSGEYANVRDSEVYKKIEEVVTMLCGVVNSGDPETVAGAFYTAFVHEHRTLQAQAVKAIIGFFDLYKDEEWDLRNRAAVRAAEIITQAAERDEIYIPLV